MEYLTDIVDYCVADVDAIFELSKQMNKQTHFTQSGALAAVAARQFIVGSIDASGVFSIASRPVVHVTRAAAQAEAARLASLDSTGKAYVVMQLVGGAKAAAVVAL